MWDNGLLSTSIWSRILRDRGSIANSTAASTKPVDPDARGSARSLANCPMCSRRISSSMRCVPWADSKSSRCQSRTWLAAVKVPRARSAAFSAVKASRSCCRISLSMRCALWADSFSSRCQSRTWLAAVKVPRARSAAFSAVKALCCCCPISSSMRCVPWADSKSSRCQSRVSSCNPVAFRIWLAALAEARTFGAPPRSHLAGWQQPRQLLNSIFSHI